MEKQILRAVEEAYRKGLQDAKGLNDISPFLLTSQIVAHEVANKFCQPLVTCSVCDGCGSKFDAMDISVGVCYCCQKEIKQTDL